jgi:hypothetical protein
LSSGVAAEDLFRLGEGAVGDRHLAAGALVHAKPCRTEMHTLRCNQPARFHALFDELAHGCHFGLRRRAIVGFVRENADETHVWSWIELVCSL